MKKVLKDNKVAHHRIHCPSISNCAFWTLFAIGLVVIYSFLHQARHRVNDKYLFPVIAKNQTLLEALLLNDSKIDLNDFNLYTHKGYIPLKEIKEEAYQPLGYDMVEATLPVPTLRMFKEPTCEEVFVDWLKLANLPQLEKPPIHHPVIQADDYLINGYSALSWAYMNNNTHSEKKPTNWHRIAEFMSFSKSQLAGLEYQAESESIFNAMSAYRLDGKSGFIVGSMQPWLEVMALKNGASKILTVEHYPIEIPDAFKDRISTIHPKKFAENWNNYHESFDFAASFSNIQHFGLGRFGDALDAFGDTKEMLKIKCMLKKGGLLYLGIPIGVDAVQYNIQRIYGPLRMAMLFVGYEWVASYSHESTQPITFTMKSLSSKGVFQSQHYTIVLKKM